MILNWRRGIEPGIKNILKISLTDRKESSQLESFSLKNWIFNRLKNRFNRSNHGKSENFENLEIFWKNIFKTSFYDMKCMSMIPNVLKNSFPSIKSTFIKIQKFSSQNFYPKTLKSIRHFKNHNFGWPQKLTHNHMYRV